MKVESFARGNAAVVMISGRLTEDVASQFEDVCRESLAEGLKKLVVNVAELEYISSLGLRSLVRIAQAAQKAGGAMILCGVKGLVKEVLDMTHLTQFFPMFESVDAALAVL